MKYFTQYDNETWEQAKNSHSTGFDSIEEAYDDAEWQALPDEHFVVKDCNGIIVAEGTAQ